MSRSSRPIPPLNALRFFEAAARHGSFARAADELSVTPAAVSRQVKLLEDFFGVDFFVREPGGVTLTPEARSYAAQLTRSLKSIAQATDDFRARQTSAILLVRGYTIFLVKWLVPRLPAFQKQHPNIRVRLAGGSMGGGLRADADVTIRYGAPNWRGGRAVALFTDELVPVCSRSFLAANGLKGKALTALQLARLPLLALEARRDDWPDWFAEAGVGLPKGQQQFFEDLAVVFEFARRGHGVALAQRRYIEDELAAGTLIEVSRQVLRRDVGYWALADAESAAKDKVAAFLDWLETRPTAGP